MLRCFDSREMHPEHGHSTFVQSLTDVGFIDQGLQCEIKNIRRDALFVVKPPELANDRTLSTVLLRRASGKAV